MNKEQLKTLLLELIEKEVSLDQAAKILWQLRYYVECCRAMEQAEHDGLEGESVEFYRQNLTRARMQLDHYLVVNDIQTLKGL